ncbi:MAG TPA: hypothetical protein VIL42_07085 [Sphingomicrobium sp.]|jgi:hypothetical protein
MFGAVRRLPLYGALPLGCALAALCPSGAAASDTRFFTPDTFELSGDLRFVLVDGEPSWVEGGFGKLRSGSDGGSRLTPQLGNANLIWQPQFTWSLSATVVATIQGGERTEAGVNQAFLSFRPMRSSSGTSLSARAGLMWPPVSLEHEGADWHVGDSITPSAINSWIGEEVRPLALEGTVSTSIGSHRLRATAAAIAANDTSGTLLTFRGWALHDRITLGFRRQPLPPLGDDVSTFQPRYTHPLIDIHSGFAHRPGYYAKLSWQPPVPVRVDLFRYDNRADPEDVNLEMEWGWRTAFDNVGVVADLGAGTTLKAQAMQGRTRMGFMEGDRRWIDNRFRSAFLMLTKPVGPIGLAVRGEAFGTRNRGFHWDHEYDEHGWSAMVAGSREFGRFTGLLELLHVASTSPAREHSDLPFRQRQTQLQMGLRTRW